MNKKTSLTNRLILGSIFAILLVAIDQFTKYLATTKLKGKGPFVLIDGIFQLTYSENRGAAFGTMQNQRIYLIISTTIVIALIICFYIKLPDTKKYFYLKLICIFVIAGALGNYIDRLRLHYVVDLFDFTLIHFPIFNMADSYITVSSIVLIILYIFYYKEEDFAFLSRKKKEKK